MIIYLQDWFKVLYALETVGVAILTSLELGLQLKFLRQPYKRLRLLLYTITQSPHCPFFPSPSAFFLFDLILF